MFSRWVCNASPLILLGKIDQLRLLRELNDELIIPAGVVREVRAKPANSLEELIASPSVIVESVDLIPQDIAAWDLGQGESEVLAHAAQVEGCRVVIDDLEARRCAHSLGLSVIGTLGVVLSARKRGLLPAAAPVISQLRRSGLYVADELVRKALHHVGES